MAYRYPGLRTAELLVRSGTTVRAAVNATFTLVRAGTSTPATIYSDDNWTIANTTGTVTTDSSGNYSVLLDPQYKYQVVYKGFPYPPWSVIADDRESDSDIADHAELTDGVHGIPEGETIATQEYVTDAIAGISAPNQVHLEATDPGPSDGIDGDAWINVSTWWIYGPKSGGSWPPGQSLIGPPGDSGVLSDLNPLPLGPAQAGTSTASSRSDHVHQKPTAGEIGAAGVNGPFAPMMTNASASVRIVGGRPSGPPVAGTWLLGDAVPTQDGAIWTCTLAGTVGLWSCIGHITNTAASNLANVASSGISSEAARADHVHSNSGLVRSDEKGVANGVATLDSSGDLTAGQLPSSVVRNDAAVNLNGQQLSNYCAPVTRLSSATTTYTLNPTTDNGRVIEFSCTTAGTVTVPNNLPIGFSCVIAQNASGQITIVAGSGAFVQGVGGAVKTPGQYGAVSLICRDNSSGTAASTRVYGGVA